MKPAFRRVFQFSLLITFTFLPVALRARELDLGTKTPCDA